MYCSTWPGQDSPLDIEMSFLWISHTVNEAEKFYLTEYEDKVGKLWSPKE